jgi:hypothetical protein
MINKKILMEKIWAEFPLGVRNNLEKEAFQAYAYICMEELEKELRGEKNG